MNETPITQKKIRDLIIEFETLMEERHVHLKKAYELIIGNKFFTDKKKINWSSAALLMRKPSWIFDVRSIVNPKEIIKKGL